MKRILSYLFILSLTIPAIAQQEIKIMSYNIRLDVASDGENKWDNRKDRVAGVMNYYDADFIGGQEVQHHQLEYLLKELKGYGYIGAGRDDGKTGGEYSCIFYKTSSFKLIKQSTFWLSPTPDSISKGWDAAYNRVCTYGLFQVKGTRHYLWVMNTHFDHIGKEARIESAKLIMKRIRELNTGNFPVILMGDLNARPDEPPVQYLAQSMQNSRNISKIVYGNADTWNGFKFNAKPDGCIDYIFVSNDPRINVTRFATLTDSYDLKYPSDHLPVLATITLNK